VTETPDQRVRRLQAELAAAKADQRVAQLSAELAEAHSGSLPAAPDGDDGDGAAGAGRAPEPAESPGYPPVDGRLADPPRHVPLAFLAAAFSWRWWEAWAFFMVAVTPIALWGGIPWTGTVAGILTLVVAIVLRLRGDRTNFLLLRRGKVADRVRVRQDSTGTYYSGVTYQNVRMAVAHGWQVKREWYSGPGTRSVLDYTVDGKPGTMTLHGLPYAGGVVLADPRRPSRARCVSQFPYDLGRDASGNWVGTVSTRVWVGCFFTLAMWGGWALLVLYWQFAVVG
jgi:hypothetical protein